MGYIKDLTKKAPIKTDEIIIEKSDGSGTFKTTINDAVNSSDVNTSLENIINGTVANMLKPTFATTTKSGVTITNNGDGTYTLNGTASSTTTFTLDVLNKYMKEGVEYKFVGCPSGGSTSSYYFSIWYAKADIGNGSSFIKSTNTMNLEFRIEKDVVCDNLILKPMLTTNLSATYDDFVPYTGDSGRLNEDISALKNTLVDNAGAHNGIFTEKFLGTFNTVDEVKKFLSDHKVAEKQYTGLYVGDYLRLNDGVYNKDWVIAGFELYNNKGDTPLTVGNIVLIPRTPLVNKPMNPTNTTEGGYYNSAMHQTHIPEIVANLEKVLGDTLLTRRCLLTNSMSSTLPSMAGAGFTGCSNGWAWYDCKAVLMSEVEIYGSTIFSSSFYDVGEACEKLPIFNFINHVKYSRSNLWLRAVASASVFAVANNGGIANDNNASGSWGVSPIIVVGLI